MYNEFASLYDELMNDFDYEMWFNYIRDIFASYKKNPRKILEMACGTGNLSYYLAKERYKLTCFDLSEEMLAIAYAKLASFRHVKILRQNMIDFSIDDSFDSILAICDSINYILEEEDLLESFKRVYQHLNDGGIFIFDINSYYKLSQIIGNNTFIEDRGDIYYSWQNQYDNSRDICDFYLTFFYSNDGENYERADEHHRERAYKVDKIKKLLTMAGFKQVDAYKAFSLEPYDEKDERINLVALKG